MEFVGKLAQNKRLLAIIAVVLIFVFGVGIAAYVILKDPTRSAADSVPYINKNEHIGVLDVLSKDQLRSAFGEGAEVNDVEESGTLHSGTVRSETVTFWVKSPEGGLKFELDARAYPTKEDLQNARVFTAAEAKKIEGVGEEAHFFVPRLQADTREHQTSLIATEGKVVYKFTIIQRQNAAAYGVTDAKAILEKAAKSANLQAVQ